MNTDDMSLVTLIVRHDFLFNKKALTVYLKDNKRLICMYGRNKMHLKSQNLIEAFFTKLQEELFCNCLELNN